MGDAYRLVATPKFESPYQVVRPDGLPDVHLTLFAREQLQSLSASSVPLYLREIVAFLNWSKNDPVVQRYKWRIDGSPTEVRNLLREYLAVAAKCKLTSRADGLGIKATYVVQAAGNTINIRTLLAALKRLFEMLIARGMYHHPNPLLHEEAVRFASGLREARRDAFRKFQGRLPMPAESGVDPPSGIRLSENYFRCVERQWWPRTIDDRDLPSLVYEAGKSYGWSLRELCIACMLFESGARISEICSLTAADWARSRFGASFDAPNKGSHGGRIKLLLVSQPTVKLLRKYFDGESDRRACDRTRLAMRDLLTLVDQGSAGLRDIPLFLTERGTMLSARLFREHYWKPALRAAGLDVDPHQGRHWFVTNALRNIEADATSETDLRRRKDELIQYMAWKTGERTLAAYEHVQRREQFLDTLTAIHHKMARRSKQRPSAGAAFDGRPQSWPDNGGDEGHEQDARLFILEGAQQRTSAEKLLAMQFSLQRLPIDAARLRLQLDVKPLQRLIELADCLLFVDTLIALHALYRGFGRIRDCVCQLSLSAAGRPFQQQRLLQFCRQVHVVVAIESAI